MPAPANDLVLGVNIALGGAAVGQCSAMDGNGDGTATVDELVGAVQNALGGCPVVTTASPSPTPPVTPGEPTPALRGEIAAGNQHAVRDDVPARRDGDRLRGARRLQNQPAALRPRQRAGHAVDVRRPDGTALAYAARDAHGTADLELVIAGLDGSGAQQITHGLGVEHRLWSPDGDYLLVRPFVAGRPKIYRLRRDGTGITDLSNNDAFELAGDWR